MIEMSTELVLWFLHNLKCLKIAAERAGTSEEKSLTRDMEAKYFQKVLQPRGNGGVGHQPAREHGSLSVLRRNTDRGARF